VVLVGVGVVVLVGVGVGVTTGATVAIKLLIKNKDDEESVTGDNSIICGAEIGADIILSSIKVLM